LQREHRNFSIMPRVKPVIADNRLLAALPRPDQQRILAQCDHVELVADEVLHEAGAVQRYAYFPTGGFISLVTPLDATAGLEVNLVGSEGMVGDSILLDVPVSPLHHLVQGSGGALRLSAAAMRRELERSSSLRRRLNRYAYVKMNQIAQTAACIRFHVVEARLARWLLMRHDRAPGDEFHATHEFLAYVLGVRRVGITQAATSLQRRRLISYSRGNIRILDRRGLEAASCACYFSATALYDRILGAGSPR
jgi:CRP-like cAMP-binding protein